jgi:primary-amine oxidase
MLLPGLPTWIEANKDASIDNTDIVVWHTFGVTHFPTPEDYPIMPCEPMTVLLRPRNFFTQNAALDVPPAFSTRPSDVAAGRKGYRGPV